MHSNTVHTNNNSLHGSHVWVRTDLVQAILDHRGTLPVNWRPRKRNRTASSSGEWGWCRAVVVSSGSASPKKSVQQETPAAAVTSPFAVKLRKTTTTTRTTAPSAHKTQQEQWRGSPDRKKAVHLTVTVQDSELAPVELQHETVSFTWNHDAAAVCWTANTWWQSADDEGPPEDLTQLEQLHEPAVVYCLQRRYEDDYIYTWTGKILLALNPFRAVDSLYGHQVMAHYWKAPSSQELEASRPPPHVYAIAADAYQSMMESLSTTSRRNGGGENQSILVSGESGAGKTVTTKIIMGYLAALSERSDHRQQQERGPDGIEKQVLQSNPILESFGNARTIRNDNSSRFGKFIEIHFNGSGCLVSASIETYLLEKVRLISQAPGERNYHVFYELLAGLPQKNRKDLCIGNMTAKDFHMTAASGTFDRRDGVEDRESYKELRTALDTVGFTPEEQQDLFIVVCAVLHASNLTFCEASDNDSVSLDTRNRSLRSAIALWDVEMEALSKALTLCAIEARGEVLYKNLSLAQAQKAVEGLIKTTYGALFSFFFKRVNESIAAKNGASRGTASIGVLDIFGFESFETNSFEQLCINYCNEALQQQFNRFVFTLEQQEYQKEGIEWSFISFPDNQDVLELIDKKHDGILSVLDEQSRLARCTDATFARAVYEKCEGHERFQATKAQKASLAFAIHHYAGLVEYDTENFLEKNKAELPKETRELLQSSRLPFLAQLGRDLSGPSSSPVNRKKQPHRSSSSLMRESVGTQFAAQLRVLRTRIETTAPHYVRCLKPNDDLVPNSFNALVIADQLRCAGVLEAIRVSRVGFPHRYYHERFVQRYGVLCRSAMVKKSRFGKAVPIQDPQEACTRLVEAVVPELEASMEEGQGGRKGEIFLGMQMGKTKVFLRRRAFEALEYLRNRKLELAAARIQSMVRMHFCKSEFLIAVYSAVIIQSFVRQKAAYRSFRVQRRELSALMIQCAWRTHKAKRVLDAALYIAWWGQSTYRGAIARQYCAFLFLDQKVSSIQRAWRRHVSGRHFRKLRRCVISLQNRHRSRVAYRQLLELRREQRDLSTVAAERDKLREETLRLKRELEQAKKTPPPVVRTPPRPEKTVEVKALRSEVNRLQVELEKAHRMSTPTNSNSRELELLMHHLAQKEEELEVMRREMELMRSREDSSSVMSSSFRNSIGSGGSHMSGRRGSPVRSDVSLLDIEPDEEGTDADFLAPRQITPPPQSRVPLSPLRAATGDELKHLHASIRHGNRQLFDQIIHSTSEVCLLVNQGDRYGRTALHVTAQVSNVDMALALLHKGAVVNSQDDDGETPLHLSRTGAMTEALLKEGNANPNIPNVDGICPIHLAVQRRNIESVRALLRKNANVNNADNIRWFTALHLIALPARDEAQDSPETDKRNRIAQLLTGVHGQHAPDLNYQDNEGNAPLHYIAQLETEDACDLMNTFLDKDANPNVLNVRNQSPLHLLCHNTALRNRDIFQEMLHSMLFHAANPNLQSLTGCTPLHLSLYHTDIDSAVQLVHSGAELHMVWKKPKRWESFWDDMGSAEVLALDMVSDEYSLHRILAAITKPQMLAPTRPWCMHCKSALGTFSRALHCRHCSRLVCGKCTRTCLPADFFPKSFGITEASWSCTVCEKILTTQKEVMSNETHPVSSYGDEDDDDHFSC